MQMSLFGPDWAAEVCNIVTTGLELESGEWRRVGEWERDPEYQFTSLGRDCRGSAASLARL